MFERAHSTYQEAKSKNELAKVLYQSLINLSYIPPGWLSDKHSFRK